jgi:hypothetical protein
LALQPFFHRLVDERAVSDTQRGVGFQNLRHHRRAARRVERPRGVHPEIPNLVPVRRVGKQSILGLVFAGRIEFANGERRPA